MKNELNYGLTPAHPSANAGKSLVFLCLIRRSVCIINHVMADETKNTEENNEPKTVNEGNENNRLRLSEEELAVLANQVAKSFKAREFKVVAGYVAKSLTPKQYWLIGKSLRKAPLFWILVAAAILLPCYTAWKTIPHFIKERAQAAWNQAITNEVKLQFQEPRISNIVVAVASSEATNIIRLQVAPKVAAVEKLLSDKVQYMETNLDYMAENFYSRICNEMISGGDTNRCIFRTFPDGTSQVIFKLTAVPLPKSIQGIQNHPGVPQVPLSYISAQRNIAFLLISSPVAIITNCTFFLQYVKDSHSTELWKTVEIRNGAVFLNGTERISFPQLDK